MKGQIVKWGNSLAIRIPKTVTDAAKLKEGDALEIEAAGEGRVELQTAKQGSDIGAADCRNYAGEPLLRNIFRRRNRQGSG